VDQFRPVDVGWFSHENPFEFEIGNFRYAPDARRFWGGTPSVLPFMIARASIDQLQSIGMERIQAHNWGLSGRLVAAAQKEGWRLVTPAEAERRGGTVCIGFPQAEEVVRRLGEAGIWVDARAGFGVRFSPHMYVGEAAVSRTIETLRQVLRDLA
jgi:kynureninase